MNYLYFFVFWTQEKNHKYIIEWTFLWKHWKTKIPTATMPDYYSISKLCILKLTLAYALYNTFSSRSFLSKSWLFSTKFKKTIYKICKQLPQIAWPSSMLQTTIELLFYFWINGLNKFERIEPQKWWKMCLKFTKNYFCQLIFKTITRPAHPTTRCTARKGKSAWIERWPVFLLLFKNCNKIVKKTFVSNYEKYNLNQTRKK